MTAQASEGMCRVLGPGSSTKSAVADLVLFLASDRSGNTTGTDVRIDGGLVTTL